MFTFCNLQWDPPNAQLQPKDFLATSVIWLFYRLFSSHRIEQTGSERTSCATGSLLSQIERIIGPTLETRILGETGSKEFRAQNTIPLMRCWALRQCPHQDSDLILAKEPSHSQEKVLGMFNCRM